MASWYIISKLIHRYDVMENKKKFIVIEGPIGVGKTTLANLIATATKSYFSRISAVSSGVSELRRITNEARDRLGMQGQRTIVFIDEIHRFNKSQQDVILPYVENGTIILIGATTENPSFEVISPLLSRCRVLKLNPLTSKELAHILSRAKAEDIILSQQNIIMDAETESLLLSSCGGDARKMLNTFELAISLAGNESISDENISNALQQKHVIYNKTGEYHYDVISAFIKSIRGSDPNAAVYWLARMIEGGEDVKFIARRLIILASEDIGNANPTALVIANNCFQAINVIGFPEARITLSQTVIYLACSPKSNTSYMAINQAQEEVKKSGNLSVPLHLRNAPSKLMKELGYGEDYLYSHDKPNDTQEFLPDKISGTTFYKPLNNVKEKAYREGLKDLWKGKYNY